MVHPDDTPLGRAACVSTPPPAPVRAKKPNRKPRKAAPQARPPAARQPVPTDPVVDARQTQAYDLSIQGISNAQIAGLLHVSRRTIAEDIDMEGQRRALERDLDRQATIGRSLARYEKIIGEGFLRAQELRRDARASASSMERTALRGIIPREMAVIIRAQQAIEAVLGLHKVDVKVSNTTVTVNAPDVTQTIRDVFEAMPPEDRARFREEAYRRKMALRNVTPGFALPEQAGQAGKIEPESPKSRLETTPYRMDSQARGEARRKEVG